MTGKTLMNQLGQTIKHPLTHPGRAIALGVGGYLFVDYLVAKEGHSSIAKLANAIMPTTHAIPPPPRVAPPPVPARLATAPAAVHPAAAAAAGYYAGAPFGPGWGRGNMPYMYGRRWPETPAEIAAAHRDWAAASGQYPEQWTQSAYPWS